MPSNKRKIQCHHNLRHIFTTAQYSLQQMHLPSDALRQQYASYTLPHQYNIHRTSTKKYQPTNCS